MFKHLIGFTAAAILFAAVPGAAFAAKGAANKPAVVMYATETCGYCAKARAYFREHHVAWKEHDIGTSAQAKREFQNLHGRGTPLIFVGNERIDGFHKARLDALLGAG